MHVLGALKDFALETNSRYKEIFIGTSVGLFAALGELFLGAIEKREPFFTHVARHEPTSLHMLEHYVFVLGGFTLGYMWWHASSEYRKLDSMMAELEESEARYRDIFENVGDMICIIDVKCRIVESNRRFEEVLGYSKEEMIGMDLRGLIGPGSIRSLDRVRKKVKEEERLLGTEIEFISKSGKRCIGELHCTAKYDGGVLKQVRCIIIDITERKHAEDEMRKKLMRYRIEKGRAYLIEEKKLDIGLDVFADLLSSGWSGAAISRTPPEGLKELCSEKTPLIEMGTEEGMLRPQTEELKEKIEDELFWAEAVLLDRIDYLINKNGFDETLKFVQELSEIFYLENRILVLSLDPEVLNPREVALLEKETERPAPKHSVAIPDELYSILKFVYGQNREGKMPSYSDVGSRFEITKPTTRRRIGELRAKGYLIEVRRGRSKVLELSEKGKELF